MNEEEKFKKRVVKEESIKLPDPNPEKKANKIIKYIPPTIHKRKNLNNGSTSKKTYDIK